MNKSFLIFVILTLVAIITGGVIFARDFGEPKITNTTASTPLATTLESPTPSEAPTPKQFSTPVPTPFSTPPQLQIQKPSINIRRGEGGDD